MDLTPESSEILPVASVYKNLDFYIQSFNNRFVGNIFEDIVELNDHSFVIISSNIDSKYNCGFITKYSSTEDIPNAAKNFINPGYGPCSSLALSTSSINPTSIFAGFDSGNIVLLDNELSVVENGRFFHNMITSIRLNCGQNCLVGGDLDGRMAVIDSNELQAITFYDHAHDGPINDIKTSADNDQLVMTCGADREVVVWDLRVESTSSKPASVIVSSTSQPTALHWPSAKEITFGTEAGNVVRYDIRNKRVLANEKMFSDRIHQIKAIKNDHVLAIIADDGNDLLLYNTELTKLLHRESPPKNISIRSCIEHQNKLITVGSAQSILVHDILQKL